MYKKKLPEIALYNVVVTGVSQIVFMGMFAYNHKNNDKSTISCNTVTAGLQFINSSYVRIDGLLFNVSCSSRAGISFYNVSSVNIYQSTIQNLYNLGMLIANSVNLTISECSFTAANGLDVHNESNQLLLYSVSIISNSLEEVHYNISDSVFVGNLPTLGGGLHIYTTNTMYILYISSSSSNLQLIGNTDNDKTSVQCKDFIYKAIQLLPHVSQGTGTFSVPSTPFPFSKSLSLI